MTKKIEIVDSIMGSHKSTEIIKWMSQRPQNRYIYVSPLLSEVDEGGRLHQEVCNISFHSPSGEDSTKGVHLLELLKGGANVSCTHNLYKLMTEDHFEAIKQHDYTLIIDEEVGLIESFNEYTTADLKWLLAEGHIYISENDGQVMWCNERVETSDVGHRYYRLRQMCKSGCLYTTKRSDTMLNVQLPTSLVDSSIRTIILTYMFKGTILESFLKLKGFEVVEFSGIVDGEIQLSKVDGNMIRELLVITPPPKKFDLRGKLTYTWYMKPQKGDLNKVKNAIVRTAANWDIESDQLIYTFPKSRSSVGIGKNEKIKPIGYTKRKDGSHCWLAATTRATNNYRHITHMIHAYNRHPNVAVASYLQDYGHPVDADVFALSEMIQWLWRGCIRDGKKMTVCIFSNRMERLLREWLDTL